MAVVRWDDSRLPMVRVTFRARHTRNRLDAAMVAELTRAVDRAESIADAEILVLDAEGDAFCAGLALTAGERADWSGRIACIQHLLTQLARSRLVTVAVVDAPAVGGGVGLAAACDQVLVGPTGGFRLTEVLLGLVPAVVLPVIGRRTGARRAYSLALTTREVTGEHAVSIGLADEYAEDTELALRALLRRLRGARRGAVRALKRYRRELDGDPAAAQELIEELLRERLADPEVIDRLVRLELEGMLP